MKYAFEYLDTPHGDHQVIISCPPGDHLMSARSPSDVLGDHLMSTLASHLQLLRPKTRAQGPCLAMLHILRKANVESWLQIGSCTAGGLHCSLPAGAFEPPGACSDEHIHCAGAQATASASQEPSSLHQAAVPKQLAKGGESDVLANILPINKSAFW